MKRVLMLIPAATLAAAGPVDGPIAVNLPPRVSLTSPADGFVGVLGCPVTFAAVAEDIDNQILLGRAATPDDVPVIADDGIDRVEFYLNGRLLAADYTAPYEVTVDRGPFVPQNEGKNTTFARAYDDDKPQLVTDSPAMSFLMTDPPPGLPGEHCLEATPPPDPLPVEANEEGGRH